MKSTHFYLSKFFYPKKIVKIVNRNMIHQWYAGHYGLDCNSKKMCIDHFIKIGFINNFNPNPLFNTEWAKFKYLSDIKNINEKQIDLYRFFKYFEDYNNFQSSSIVLNKNYFINKYSKILDSKFSAEMNFIFLYRQLELKGIINENVFNTKFYFGNILEIINLYQNNYIKKNLHNFIIL